MVPKNKSEPPQQKIPDALKATFAERSQYNAPDTPPKPKLEAVFLRQTEGDGMTGDPISAGSFPKLTPLIGRKDNRHQCSLFASLCESAEVDLEMEMDGSIRICPAQDPLEGSGSPSQQFNALLARHRHPEKSAPIKWTETPFSPKEVEMMMHLGPQQLGVEACVYALTRLAVTVSAAIKSNNPLTSGYALQALLKLGEFGSNVHRRNLIDKSTKGGQAQATILAAVQRLYRDYTNKIPMPEKGELSNPVHLMLCYYASGMNALSDASIPALTESNHLTTGSVSGELYSYIVSETLKNVATRQASTTLEQQERIKKLKAQL
ncbi:MAG: hypothetical protein GY918_12725 [Gammaproteobacteria bacterium]|nr:hypothetical protein [Gammaproteobacteria bacterium]